VPTTGDGISNHPMDGSVWIIDFESAEVVSDSTKSEILEGENIEVERLLNDIMSGKQYI
jgi:predicted Ser/Thr protein kinase